MASSLAEAIRSGVRAARARCGDPLARVGVVYPTPIAGHQLQRDLVAGGGLLGVDFLTPGEIVAALGRPRLAGQGRRPEPPGWLAALLSALLSRLDLAPYSQTLQQPGWRGPLLAALQELEAAGVPPDLLRTVGVQPDLHARCALLASLLEAVAAERTAERLYSQQELAQAALLHQASGTWPGRPGEVQAAIVVGDTMLSPQAHQVLCRWLADRDPLRIVLEPQESLPPATCGLRLAADHAQARLTTVQTPPTALGHLQRHAFSTDAGGGAAAPADGSVVLAATADEVRDMESVVREVMLAVREGVALDQIAVVLPDPSQAVVLEEALSQAGLPAVWLTGPPLRQSAVARFLLLALRVAQGEEEASPLRWHQLLTASGGGRSRWRRLLAEVPVGGLEAIRAHLRRQRAAAEEGTPQRDAVEALQQGLEQRAAWLAALPQQAPLGEHAAAWRGLLERGWPAEPVRAKVLRLLEDWQGGGQAGGPISLAAAAAQLSTALEQTPLLRGSLHDRAIRVLPPMAMLGSSHARVFLTGVTEGRLPRRIQDSGVLSEDLRAALRAAGAPMVTRAEREAVEQRRMAAVLSGCRERLWLSSPRADLLEGRPTLPGALLLQVASALAGTRLSPATLQPWLVPHGQRSTPAPLPADAAGRAEYRLARAAHAPHDHLSDLLHHPTLRRLIRLQRAVDQVLYEGKPPNAWTGWVDPALQVAPALAGAPLDAAALARLVHDPSAYFFRDLLGVYAAQALRGSGGLSETDLRRAVLKLTEQAPRPSDFAAAWAEQVARWSQHLGLQAADQQALLARGLRHHQSLQRQDALNALPAPPVAGAALPGGFVVTVADAWLHGTTLLERRQHVEPKAVKPSDQEGLRLLAQGYALAAAGQPVTQVRQVGLNQQDRKGSLAEQRADFAATVEAGAARAAAGWWPTLSSEGAGERFLLAREQQDGKHLDPAEVFLRLLPLLSPSAPK